MTDKLNLRNKSDGETTVNENTGDTDNSATFTTVSYKKHSTTTKGKKPRKKSTKQPQSIKRTTASSPVHTDDNVVITKAEVTNLRKLATPRPALDHTKSTETKSDGDLTPGKTTLISSSLGAGIGRRFKNETRKTCSYVRRGATINRISNDLGINDGYKDSDKIVLLCGTNDLANSTLGQTIISYDNLLDQALSLNREAQIYVAGLPLRWDKPDINENILNFNAYLEHKSKKTDIIDYINNNIFTHCRKTHYSVDKLHLNNQGRDLMARNIEMALNFHKSNDTQRR